jgi:hypothetical protein
VKTRIGGGGSASYRLFSAAGLFLERKLWIRPLIGAVVLVFVSFWVRETIEEVMEAQLKGELQAILSADVEALRLLFLAQEELTSIAAADPRVRALARELVAAAGPVTADRPRSPALAELRAALRPWVRDYEFTGFEVVDPRLRLAASDREELIGLEFNRGATDAAERALAGRATVSRPFASRVTLPDADGVSRAGTPAMYALAPIRGEDGRVFAALGLRMRPDGVFTRVLNVGQFGQSGETLAFDRSGLLLSRSRFDDDLKRIGLLVDQPHIRSVLNVELRDPQVDMTTGARPPLRRREQPLTRMVGAAINGQSGVDVQGYRDYRGVPVVGAWTWLPEYSLGVATEVQREEAYKPLTILRRTFWILFALLVLAALALFFFTVVVARLRRSAQRAALAAKQLGQYTLDEKIGEGAMGVVYRAHHALLRRPTAIKLLSVEKTDDRSIARFEREVQLTSQLNHPNTIVIYDYGRTAEGVFYYAMEYLDGIDLQVLVERDGPQPEGRVIHILTQVCASLAEAHSVGLIHRDIKPANIILNHRGGVSDVVKLLDFGLVKAVDFRREASLTVHGAITGTPLYLAPEGITNPDQVDARSDLYSVAAVGYFLLTGRPVFDAQRLAELMFQQVHEQPERPSSRLATPVAHDLESLLLRCLSKSPAERPGSARELAEELGRCAAAGSWTAGDADAWWQAHAAAEATSPPAPVATTVEIDRAPLVATSNDLTRQRNPL